MKGLVLDDKGLRIAEGKDYFHSRVERLLFEPENGILGNPDWGSRIPTEFFHEPEDETIAQEIINEVGFLFTSRENQLVLSSVGVNIIPTSEGANGIALEIGVLMPNNTDEEVEEIIKFFKISEV